MTLVNLHYTMCWHHMMDECARIGMSTRTGCHMLIYRKLLRLHPSDLAASSNSEVRGSVRIGPAYETRKQRIAISCAPQSALTQPGPPGEQPGDDGRRAHRAGGL